MIPRKSAAVLFLLILLSSGHSADDGFNCPFIEVAALLSVSDSAQSDRSFVSLAWVARDFSVTICSADTMDRCVFNLNRYISGNKTVPTRLFSFTPGKYRVSYQHHHDPGSHSSATWSDTVIDLKAGTWYVTRFLETSIESRGQSVMHLVRTKAWRVELKSAAKEIVVKHASGEKPAIKTIVLVGIVLVTLLFGGIMAYAR